MLGLEFSCVTMSHLATTVEVEGRWITPLQRPAQSTGAFVRFNRWLCSMFNTRLNADLASSLCIKILGDCSAWILNLLQLSLSLVLFLMRKKNVLHWTFKSPANNEIHWQRQWVTFLHNTYMVQSWEQQSFIWLLTIVVSYSVNWIQFI